MIVRQIRRIAGDGGNISYHVGIQTSAGTALQCSFSGNMFVGPVVLISSSEDGRACEVVIDQPRRFGEFATEQWVRSFFEEWQHEDCQTEDCETYRQTG